MNDPITLITPGEEHPGDIALLQMAELEGDGWRKMQQEHREFDMMSDTDFYAVLQQFQEGVRYGLCIYGSGGGHRYTVNEEGVIIFSGGHCTKDAYDHAEKIGFACSAWVDPSAYNREKNRRESQNRDALTGLVDQIIAVVLERAGYHSETDLHKEVRGHQPLVSHVGSRITGWVAQQLCVADGDYMHKQANQLRTEAEQIDFFRWPQ